MTVWYTARGAGLAALVLLTVSTAAGALGSGGFRAPATRVVVQYLHRAAAAMGLGLLALHITAILADSYAGVGWLGAVVPFASGYRPNVVALGSIAAYLFLLVGATGAARGRLAVSPAAAVGWRRIHLAAYAGWALSALHGFTIGTDSGREWVRWLYVACVLAVGASGAARALLGTRRRVPGTGAVRPLVRPEVSA